MYEFEKHKKLTEFISEMANTGKAPREWTSFIETLNEALRIHDVVGRSEQCDHDYSDGTGTGWNVCKKCGDMY